MRLFYVLLFSLAVAGCSTSKQAAAISQVLRAREQAARSRYLPMEEPNDITKPQKFDPGQFNLGIQAIDTSACPATFQSAWLDYTMDFDQAVGFRTIPAIDNPDDAARIQLFDAAANNAWSTVEKRAREYGVTRHLTHYAPGSPR